MFKKVSIVILFLATCYPFVVAGDVSAETKVLTLRAAEWGDIYVQLTTNVLCNTTVFKIDVDDPGRDQMYSAALSALMGNKKVKVEENGCSGWGTNLRSFYILSE